MDVYISFWIRLSWKYPTTEVRAIWISSTEYWILHGSYIKLIERCNSRDTFQLTIWNWPFFHICWTDELLIFSVHNQLWKVLYFNRAHSDWIIIMYLRSMFWFYSCNEITNSGYIPLKRWNWSFVCILTGYIWFYGNYALL